MMSEKSCSEAANRTPSVSYPKEQEKTRYSQIIMIYKNHLHHRCLKSDVQKGSKKEPFRYRKNTAQCTGAKSQPIISA